MPPKTKTPHENAASIAPFYRFYFLYLDLAFFASGVVLILTNPSTFLLNTIPHPLTLSPPISASTLTPTTHLLLHNIASLYLCLCINQQWILRITNDVGVWRAVTGSLVLSDVGHLYAVWVAAPERMAQVAEWTSSEGINVGILVFGLVVRLAFLGGIGNKG